MKTIGAFAAKTHFSELLRQVEEGECFEIRRRNRPVARLVGVTGSDRAELVKSLVDRVCARRAAVPVTLQEIREWVREGQRE